MRAGYCPPGDELEERQFITDPRFHPVGGDELGGAEFISTEEGMPQRGVGKGAPSLTHRVSLAGAASFPRWRGEFPSLARRGS